MARQSTEVRAAGRFLEAIDRVSFDENVFASLVARAPLALRQRFLKIALCFIDHEAEVWYSGNVTEADTDHHVEAARMSEAFNVYRYNP